MLAGAAELWYNGRMDDITRAMRQAGRISPREGGGVRPVFLRWRHKTMGEVWMVNEDSG
jgi:hypothetical protein